MIHSMAQPQPDGMVKNLFKLDSDAGMSKRSGLPPPSVATRGGAGGGADAISQITAKGASVLADKVDLEMTNDEIIENKAFIWCCGNNKEGELGLGSDEKPNKPKNVVQLREFPVKDFVCSNTHSVLLTPQSDVHVAGSTLHGKMGMIGI